MAKHRLSDIWRSCSGVDIFFADKLFARGNYHWCDGIKKSGDRVISVLPPDELFEVESYLNLGGSMLKRFWRGGSDVIDEHVKDRLLLSSNVF